MQQAPKTNTHRLHLLLTISKKINRNEKIHDRVSENKTDVLKIKSKLKMKDIHTLSLLKIFSFTYNTLQVSTDFFFINVFIYAQTPHKHAAS